MNNKHNIDSISTEPNGKEQMLDIWNWFRCRISDLWHIAQMINASSLVEYLRNLSLNTRSHIKKILEHLLVCDNDAIHDILQNASERPLSDRTQCLTNIISDIQLNLELIVLDNLFDPFRVLIKNAENETEENRAMLAMRIEKELNDIFKNHEFHYPKIDDDEPTRINTIPVFPRIFNWQSDSWMNLDVDINDIIRFLQCEQLKSRIKKWVWTLDRENFERNRSIFWAKWANLIEMEKVVKKLRDLLYVELDVKVPAFRLIPLSIYDRL